MIRCITFLMLFSTATAVASQNRHLIIMKGNTPTPALATSWKKIKDGRYEFNLNVGAKIGRTLLTPAHVKSSVESRLRSRFSTKVSPKGAGKVIIRFKGDEKAFFKALSSVRIRPKTTEIAMESSVSDGGLRARKAIAEPSKDEVKGRVLAIKPDFLMVRVIKSNNSKIKNGLIRLTHKQGLEIKKNQTIFFRPNAINAGRWSYHSLEVGD